MPPKTTTIKAAPRAERTLADQGREFAKVIDLFVDGKPVDAPVDAAAHTIAMKRNMTFGGEREGALAALAAAFPGATFAWAE